MIFLALAILCSTSLNIIFKLSEKSGSNRLAVNFFNFVGATIISVIFVSKQIISDTEWLPAFFSGLGQAAAESSKLVLVTPSAFTLFIGFINGFLYFGAYYVLQLSISRNGSAMSATFNKLGVMIPAILSVLFFHEIPGVMQIVGVFVASLAIMIIYLKKEESSVVTLKAALLGTFLFGGFSNFTSKIYQVYGTEDFQNLFILFTFVFSLIFSGILMLVKDRRIKHMDVIFGLAAGIPSQFISLFLLLALTSIPAFVVFPLFSVGVILIINIINLMFFKEKLTTRQFAAIGLIIAAVVLLNI
jgi:drug/metabolite transporter (DMT)-like permease